MKTGFSKVLSVVLCLILMAATASVAFAADTALTGTGTEADPYVVSDAAGMKELAADPAKYDGKYIVLSNDVDMGGVALTPIGTADAPFAGHFNGCGFTVRNFKINLKANGGLFGYTNGAVISDVTINSATITCARNEKVGGLVGCANNTQISGVKTMNATLSAGAKGGGIVGSANGCTITDCTNACTVSVSAGANSGGIVGEAVNCEISRCINTAAINGNRQKNCGGIAGSISGTISHCLNSGSVTTSILTQNGDEFSGTAGIAGSASGTVAFCGNAGNVKSLSDGSGIVNAVAGQLKINDCYNAGGLEFDEEFAGNSNPIAPSSAGNANCVYEGDLTAKDAYAGWDFASVWFEPADYHGYAYPVLRDCNFHTLTVKETQATCTLPGGRQVTCLCGLDEHQETAAALGHNWIVSNVKEANCTYEGEKTYKCTRCQEEKPEKEILPVDPDKHVDADNDNICDLCEKTIKEEEVKKNFFQRVIDFFKRIFDWIKNLFTRNKDN